MRTAARELRGSGRRLARHVGMVLALIVGMMSMNPVNAGVLLSELMAVGSLRAFVCGRLSRSRADRSFAWIFLPAILFSTWLALMGTFVVKP